MDTVHISNQEGMSYYLIDHPNNTSQINGREEPILERIHTLSKFYKTGRTRDVNWRDYPYSMFV